MKSIKVSFHPRNYCHLKNLIEFKISDIPNDLEKLNKALNELNIVMSKVEACQDPLNDLSQVDPNLAQEKQDELSLIRSIAFDSTQLVQQSMAQVDQANNDLAKIKQELTEAEAVLKGLERSTSHAPEEGGKKKGKKDKKKDKKEESPKPKEITPEELEKLRETVSTLHSQQVPLDNVEQALYRNIVEPVKAQRAQLLTEAQNKLDEEDQKLIVAKEIAEVQQQQIRYQEVDWLIIKGFYKF